MLVTKFQSSSLSLSDRILFENELKWLTKKKINTNYIKVMSLFKMPAYSISSRDFKRQCKEEIDLNTIKPRTWISL